MKAWELFYETFASEHIRPYTVLDSVHSEVMIDIDVEKRKSWLTEEELSLCSLLGAESLTMLIAESCEGRFFKAAARGMVEAAGGCRLNHASCGVLTLVFPKDDGDVLPIPDPKPVYCIAL